MKKSLLLTGVIILLCGLTQNFDGQEKNQNRRQLPLGDKAIIEQQSKMAQSPFFSRQEPHRWMNDQMLPDQNHIATPIR